MKTSEVPRFSAISRRPPPIRDPARDAPQRSAGGGEGVVQLELEQVGGLAPLLQLAGQELDVARELAGILAPRRAELRLQLREHWRPLRVRKVLRLQDARHFRIVNQRARGDGGGDEGAGRVLHDDAARDKESGGALPLQGEGRDGGELRAGHGERHFAAVGRGGRARVVEHEGKRLRDEREALPATAGEG
jgi:hypothetical protein